METLYRSERTVVTRQQLPPVFDRVILKQAIGADAIRRLRHEATILERLGRVDGVVKIARATQQAHSSDLLALQDDDGVPLSRLIDGAPLALVDVVSLACTLAHVLSEVHRAGVIHKDINPSNILVSGAARRP
ncbi:MAG TPA: serine/threonine-protein kinase, partial [Albitalea sp.]|nr:serine/threonine-protein kinase [Albitalea sp.]